MAQPPKLINIGIIGIGYWGPNWVRVANEHPQCRITWISDLSERTFERITNLPHAHFTTDYKDMLKDHPKNQTRPDVVIICTPTITHFEIAKEVITAGMHVLIEKPLAVQEDHCKELILLAKEIGVTLMVGHTFLYNAGIQFTKKILEGNNPFYQLGPIHDISADRLSLGPIRNDVNAIWDFATHDVYILNFLLGQLPLAVSCQAGHIPEGRKELETVGVLHLFYPNNIMGRITVSSIWPEKVRKVTIVGEQAALQFDDVTPDHKIKIFRKGVSYQPPSTSTHAAHQAIVTDGDIHLPKISYTEPLKEEFKHFIECVTTGKTPLSDGSQGTEVVKILQASTTSLRERDGGKVALQWG